MSNKHQKIINNKENGKVAPRKFDIISSHNLVINTNKLEKDFILLKSRDNMMMNKDQNLKTVKNYYPVVMNTKEEIKSVGKKRNDEKSKNNTIQKKPQIMNQMQKLIEDVRKDFINLNFEELINKDTLDTRNNSYLRNLPHKK